MNKNYEIVESFERLPSPAYVCEEELLENNLKLLKRVQDETGVKILLALKGFAMYSTFDLCKKYLKGCCASGLHEALLAKEEFGGEVHTYSPAFKDEEIDEIISISNHLVFNSFNQLKRYKDKAFKKVSLGVRLNPEYSSVEVDLYNPCAPNSRLGITKGNFDESQLQYLEGFHFHALCEQNVDALEGALANFEKNFSQYFSKLKWVNFGGGHHITRADYDVEGLIKLLKDFKERYPHLEVYMEPGEAVGWQTGYLVATVLDIVNNGMDLAILDTSAEAHMPDTLAMPYRAMIRNSAVAFEKKYTYRLGGNTCLAGDIIGDYSFDEPLKVGDRIILEDMIHYTMVKTTTFNGIKLPSIIIKNKDNSFKVIKNFCYNDYKSKLS
ncbi:carboxynorspermidine decarboxylase [Aliarcobacter cryaerophilus ATCC 43158]|uniref:Carboxynorspermidine/carboxyspermidine decarboxylase n=1 Tax=Aliarcobacter cryaerophilus ATCC 43158 TaxID=1032070 RepID=A0AAD0TXU3_9BACT|nr:carboxynorspermidine decarboxylase [Aliarcobacter cryaerophilus]AYJ80548.1 carboxynorspermidine decarboxylase [Aliarcobacter cryaerophilus ATCC 43158]PRM96211.1 carboxynorspermidine decarboxylase [Aliarcobacter cryaerophilus]QCZ22884.1 carboxynorspermidine decarboxylase [Aliarcobacter cryaerophilus ATCC 43158]